MIAVSDPCEGRSTVTPIIEPPTAVCDAPRWELPENESPFIERYLREHRRSRGSKIYWLFAALLGVPIALGGLGLLLSHRDQPIGQTSSVSEEESRRSSSAQEDRVEEEEEPVSYRPLTHCLRYVQHDDFNGARAAIVSSGLTTENEDDLLRFITESQERYAHRVWCLADAVAHLLELGRFEEAAQHVKLAQQLGLCNKRFLQQVGVVVQQVKSNDPVCLQTIRDLNDYGLTSHQCAALRLRLAKSVDPARMVAQPTGDGYRISAGARHPQSGKHGLDMPDHIAAGIFQAD